MGTVQSGLKLVAGAAVGLAAGGGGVALANHELSPASQAQSTTGEVVGFAGLALGFVVPAAATVFGLGMPALRAAHLVNVSAAEARWWAVAGVAGLTGLVGAQQATVRHTWEPKPV
jgi:hypothetical protein